MCAQIHPQPTRQRAGSVAFALVHAYHRIIGQGPAVSRFKRARYATVPNARATVPLACPGAKWPQIKRIRMVEPGFLGGGRCGGGFFSPKTAAEKMCKIPAVSRALKKCAYSGRIFRCPRRSGVGIRCFGGRWLCMGTRNGGFVTPAAPTLAFGFIMTAKKLAFMGNPRMFPNVAHM